MKMWCNSWIHEPWWGVICHLKDMLPMNFFKNLETSLRRETWSFPFDIYKEFIISIKFMHETESGLLSYPPSSREFLPFLKSSNKKNIDHVQEQFSAWKSLKKSSLKFALHRNVLFRSYFVSWEICQYHWCSWNQ